MKFIMLRLSDSFSNRGWFHVLHKQASSRSTLQFVIEAVNILRVIKMMLRNIVRKSLDKLTHFLIKL